MARKGRLDRGLMQKRDASGKIVWFVRLYHEGKERRFGSFSTKTAARDFYGRQSWNRKRAGFFPERYQQRGYELVDAVIDRYLLTVTTKKPTTQMAERYFAKWWKDYFKASGSMQSRSAGWKTRGKSLLATVVVEAKDRGKKTNYMTPQRVNRYMEWLRHLVNVAVRQGKMASNPVLKLTMYKEPKGKTRFCR